MIIEKIKKNLLALRKNAPLIVNLTNYVTMDFVANALLALGASPIMTLCNEELEELVICADAVTINLGTLDNDFTQKTLRIAELAKHLKKPIILDPVGAGATRIRTETAKNLMHSSSIIRGNASEIIALSGGKSLTKGVESYNTIGEAKIIAAELATELNCCIIVSGAVDFVTEGINARESSIAYGSPIMKYVTGMGCAMTSIVAAFAAGKEDFFESSQMATYYVGLCGELAAQNTQFPGSFRTEFLNTLYKADFDKMHLMVNSNEK